VASSFDACACRALLFNVPTSKLSGGYHPPLMIGKGQKSGQGPLLAKKGHTSITETISIQANCMGKLITLVNKYQCF